MIWGYHYFWKHPHGYFFCWFYSFNKPFGGKKSEVCFLWQVFDFHDCSWKLNGKQPTLPSPVVQMSFSAQWGHVASMPTSQVSPMYDVKIQVTVPVESSWKRDYNNMGIVHSASDPGIATWFRNIIFWKQVQKTADHLWHWKWFF